MVALIEHHLNTPNSVGLIRLNEKLLAHWQHTRLPTRKRGVKRWVRRKIYANE